MHTLPYRWTRPFRVVVNFDDGPVSGASRPLTITPESRPPARIIVLEPEDVETVPFERTEQVEKFMTGSPDKAVVQALDTRLSI